VIDEGEDPPGGGIKYPQNEPITDYPPGVYEQPDKYRVNDVKVTILHERVQYLDNDGKLIIESVKDYSKRNILGEYATLDDFLQAWNAQSRKQAIIDELKERGVLLEALHEVAGNRDIDDFDLICHIAFDKMPLTKAERANNVRKRDYLSQYEGLAREVLSALLDKYAKDGARDLANTELLTIDPIRKIAGMKKILAAFGGKSEYVAAVNKLQELIYAAA
jgi:type I restriction enzyme R subunit